MMRPPKQGKGKGTSCRKQRQTQSGLPSFGPFDYVDIRNGLDCLLE